MKRQPKRIKNSIFDALCTIINSLPIGAKYSTRELFDKLPQQVKDRPVGAWTRKRGGVIHPFRSRHTALLSTKCIKQVKYGQYEVVAHIPDFLTFRMTDVNRGYKTGIGWVLGDPPIERKKAERKPKAKKPVDENQAKRKLMVLGQIEGLLRTKQLDEVIIATAEGLGPVKVFEINVGNPELIGVYDKSNVVEYVEVGKLIGMQKVKSEHWLAIMSHEFDARGIQTDSYKLNTHLAFFKGTDVPAREHSVIVAEQVKMKEQIVSILKEGLSAADAADKIIKLFNK